MASSVAKRERSSFVDKEKATQAGGTMLKMTIGAIMGGMAGAAMPGPSFVMGLASTIIGAYMQSPMMAAMGTGMIAAGSGTMAAQATGKQMKQAPDGKKFDIKKPTRRKLGVKRLDQLRRVAEQFRTALCIAYW